MEFMRMDESERQFGLVHAIPGIVIRIDAIQANDVTCPDECDCCYFRVVAVATLYFADDCYIVSSSTLSENAKSPSKGWNVPKSAIFRVA